jgi:predicted aspartyl protease
MKDDQVIIDEFAVDLHPDLVDRQVATMYFNGVPVKVFFDTGAQRTMVTREITQRIGLPIRRPQSSSHR